MNPNDLEKRIGTLVKNLTPLHNEEVDTEFSIYEHTFMQKLAVSETISGETAIRAEPANYFKSLLMVSYLSDVIKDDSFLCNKLVKLSKWMRAKENEVKMIKGLSYLTMRLVMIRLSSSFYELYQTKYFEAPKLVEMKLRYDSSEKVDLANPKLNAEPYYDAIGKMICDMVSDERKEHLENASSRADIGAIVFTDAALSILKDTTYISKINESLLKKDYFGASIHATDALQDMITEEMVKVNVMEVFKNVGIDIS